MLIADNEFLINETIPKAQSLPISKAGSGGGAG